MRKFVFIHIPKTAGTSLIESMRAAMGPSAVSPHFAASKLSEADAEALDAFQVVAGHISREDVDAFFPDRIKLTILREPLDRCVSWYYFARIQKNPAAEDVSAAGAHDIDDFFSLDHKVTFRNIYNRQVRQLGDHALNPQVDLDAALGHARDALDATAWVGFQDSFAADVERLKAAFPEFSGLSIGRLNTTPDRMARTDLEMPLKAKIAALNSYDERLYAYARGGAPA